MSRVSSFVRPALIYGVTLAAATFALQWLEYRYMLSAHPMQWVTAVIAVSFMLLGIWAGTRLVTRAAPSPFERNDKAIATLGISARECEVLELLAEGHSNKVIARRLSISPNTVKTHVARLFEKLEAGSRAQAIRNARGLKILP